MSETIFMETQVNSLMRIPEGRIRVDPQGQRMDHIIQIFFNSVQFSHSVMSNSLRPHESQHASPPYPSQTPRVLSNSCPSSRWYHPAICHPLLLLPPIPPSIRVFANESALRMRWPKYWSFSFSISPSNEHSGLIALRIDWFVLLAVQRTLKSLHQHHSLKASVL